MAGYGSDVPTYPGGGWYLAERDAGSIDHANSRAEGIEAIICTPEEQNDRSHLILFEHQTTPSPTRFDTSSPIFAPPGNSLAPNRALQRVNSQPYERRDQSHDSYLDSQRTFAGSGMAYESRPGNNFSQQTESEIEQISVEHAHSYYSSAQPLLGTEWVKIGRRGSDNVDQRFFAQDCVHNDQHGVGKRPGARLVFGRKRGSDSASVTELTDNKPFSRMDHYHSFPGPHSGPYFNHQPGPWSELNRRHTGKHTSTAEFAIQAGSPDTILSGTFGYDRSSSEENPETSATSLDSDIDNMMRSEDTIRGAQPAYGIQSQSVEQMGISDTEELSRGAPPMFVRRGAGIGFEVHHSTPREGTPLLEPGPFSRSAAGSLSNDAGNTEWLLVQRTQRSISENPSTPTSTMSQPISDILTCCECSRKFRGKYRKGNLSRHRRHKHKGKSDVVYLCEDDDCDKDFKRQDARLKHYRRQHPHLEVSPIVQRPKALRHAQAVSAQPEPQDQVLMNVYGWAEDRVD